MSELLVEKQGGVTILTLNRPDRMNAISGPMLAAFSEQLLEANRDPEVRVVVITGAGRAFCAGLDLKEQASGGNLGGGFDLREAPPVVLHQMDKPTIAAINGGAAGYGMDLAIGCDIRLASDAAKLSAAFTKRGVIPESGGTWLMPRLVGWAKASEIFFTGRTLSAEECLELGLVSKIVPGELLMKEALTLAHEIASNAPLAVQGTKRMMRMALTETFEANVHHVYLAAAALPQQGFQRGREELPGEAAAEVRG